MKSFTNARALNRRIKIVKSFVKNLYYWLVSFVAIMVGGGKKGIVSYSKNLR